MALLWMSVLAGIFSVITPTMILAIPTALIAGIGRARRLWFIPGFAIALGVAAVTFAQHRTLFGFSQDQCRLAASVVLGLVALPYLLSGLRRQGIPDAESAQTCRRGAYRACARQIGNALGGLLQGAALGVVWTPILGPILATLMAIAEIPEYTLPAMVFFGAYGLGALLPLHLIGHIGRHLSVKWPKILCLVAFLALVTGLLYAWSLDRFLQNFLLGHYALGLFPL